MYFRSYEYDMYNCHAYLAVDKILLNIYIQVEYILKELVNYRYWLVYKSPVTIAIFKCLLQRYGHLKIIICKEICSKMSSIASVNELQLCKQVAPTLLCDYVAAAKVNS